MVDKYLYPGTNVFINKLNIKDGLKLEKAEYTYVSLNISAIINNPIEIKSLFDICKIHKLLFGDLYDWAGDYRTINIYKEVAVLSGLSVKYSEYKNIEKDLKTLDNKFKIIEWKDLSHKEIIDEIVKMISSLWRIHCFREGNTRTVTTFLYILMKQLNLKVNVKFIGEHAKYFRNVLVLASIDEYSEYEYLANILMDSISMKNINENKYKTIRDYEVEKYEYRNHKYDK